MKGHMRNPWHRVKPLPAVPLVVRRRYLIEVPSTLLAAPLVVRRTYLTVMLWPLRRCASRVLNRGAQADAHSATQVLDRGGQAIARGSCLSQVLDRVRATGAAHYQRWCSADLRDCSAAALERGVGRVRWRGRRKAGGGCSARQAFQVKLILSPKQRAKPAASRTRTCTNAAVCIASGECSSRF